MLKSLSPRVCVFDIEWVPDPRAGRLVYGIDGTDDEVVAEMYVRGGATEENPRPFLKLSLCKVVSVAFVCRGPKGVSLHSYGAKEDEDERTIVGRFLAFVGEHKPCLVGFSSQDADLPILLQRAVILGVQAKRFCERPEKPWLGPDFFVRNGDHHLDLKAMLGAWGKATPSLHELCAQAGIPGKFGAQGDDVAGMWAAGWREGVVNYNECDALSTYLLFLRVAHFAGHLSGEQYEAEQQAVRDLIARESEDRPHLGEFLEEWRRLSSC